MKKYKELTDSQQQNLFFFLERCPRNNLKEIELEFNLHENKNNEGHLNNVLHGLMFETIPSDRFNRWLSQISLNGHNVIVAYEPDTTKPLSQKNVQHLLDKANKIIIPLYDINCDLLHGQSKLKIKLVDIDTSSDKFVLFSFVAPCHIYEGERNDPTLKRDVYTFYIWLDLENNLIVLSLPSTPKVFKIMGEKKKKTVGEFSLLFIQEFKNLLLNFNFKDSIWLEEALAQIIEEYYDHNNPIISKRKELFKSSQLENVFGTFIANEPDFASPQHIHRIKNDLLSLFEQELIVKYGGKPKDSVFSVFMNHVYKGSTHYKINSKKTVVLPRTETRNIVAAINNGADIASIGITYHNDKDGNQYSFTISKDKISFTLKGVTSAKIKKEIVDDVLSRLKLYSHTGEVDDSGEETNTGQ